MQAPLLQNLSRLQYLPRWVVLILDLGLVALSFVLTQVNIEFTSHQSYELLSIEKRFALLVIVYLLLFLLFKSYKGVVRHSTFQDVLLISIVTASATMFLLIISYLSYFTIGEKIFLTPFLAINSILTFGALMFFRIATKGFYGSLGNSVSSKRILVYNVNDDSIALAEAINNTSTIKYNLNGFLSSSTKFSNMRILGKRVYGLQDDEEKLIQLFEKIDAVIFVNPNYSDPEVKRALDICIDNNVNVLKSNSVLNFESSNQAIETVEKIRIEDLLLRDEINIESREVSSLITGQIILITGGAGSIGSEIVRQVCSFSPKQVIILDQAESAMHYLEIELKNQFDCVEFLLGDVTNTTLLRNLFTTYEVNTIFHAAAYKHVPLVERNPTVAAQINTLGTIQLAEIASEFKVGTFVLISTDKAINPTNVMGATKRAAEMYVQSLSSVLSNTTKFVITRFGNVLGSNGSVIPHFKKQIEAGGPLTVTHKEIYRYFMTIPEACQLVLQAGSMGSGGEVFIFDMGEQVRILDLAERMIKLSGYEPYQDIQIVFTGLRPGEKLYEELLSNSAEVLPTYHKKICISKVPFPPYSEMMNFLIELGVLVEKQSSTQIVAHLKRHIPEFVSNNSIYELLDN
ncbi:MAG: nucleoside-diphosphate sugar epimerase/dehydratase [Nonlabens sp.]